MSSRAERWGEREMEEGERGRKERAREGEGNDKGEGKRRGVEKTSAIGSSSINTALIGPLVSK